MFACSYQGIPGDLRYSLTLPNERDIDAVTVSPLLQDHTFLQTWDSCALSACHNRRNPWQIFGILWQVIAAVTHAAKSLKASSKHMVSRAYHDSLFMAQIAPTGMLFIPCRQGWSHRPDEYSSPEDIERGVTALAIALAELSMDGFDEKSELWCWKGPTWLNRGFPPILPGARRLYSKVLLLHHLEACMEPLAMTLREQIQSNHSTSERIVWN